MNELQLQAVVTQINHAIGAEGVVSAECKTLVTQYGDMIWDLLISGVSFTSIPLSSLSHTHRLAHANT